MPEFRAWPSPNSRLDHDYARHLGAIPADDDGPLWMVTLLTYDEAIRRSDAPRPDDGWQLTTALNDVGAEVVFLGDSAAQPDGTPVWDRVSVVKYPTRRSFVKMQLEGPMAESGPPTGISRAIMVGAIPSPSMPVPADLVVPPWSTVPHPAHDDDSPIVVMHLVSYADGVGSPDDMAAYARTLARVSVPHGARSSRWFAAEGTLISEGQSFDDVRFTTYPSLAAFMAVVNDLDRVAAFDRHRRHLITGQHTVALRPSIDRIARSVTA